MITMIEDIDLDVFQHHLERISKVVKEKLAEKLANLSNEERLQYLEERKQKIAESNFDITRFMSYDQGKLLVSFKNLINVMDEFAEELTK